MRHPPPHPTRSLDRRLYHLVNSLPHSTSGDQYVSIISDLGKGIGWVAASAWLAASGDRRGARAGLAATGSMLAAVALSQGLIKNVLGRRRPFVSALFGQLSVVVGPKGSDFSFPSGHTAGSFAAATSLSLFYPRQAPMLFTAASAVGLSRVYLGHHFPGDVVAGAAIGGALALLGARLAGAGTRFDARPGGPGEARDLAPR